ncbi:hypothetical protein V1264_014890 [Littorina saxatilis]|uniref:Apple domain-containing protein n=1 Tax=Littorina saxatilis TaxID=31220 RepID=A0AAN9BNW1_9CAEN
MPLVLIILVVVLVSGSATTVSTNGHLYTGVGVDDKAFSQNVIFEQPAPSAMHCAALCKLQPRCVTFTFDQEVCRGHTVLVTPITPSTPAPGARSFTRESVIVACTNHSDCSQLQNNSCFDGTCVCTPGFFYSISSDTCVSECPPAKLAGSYTRYREHGMPGIVEASKNDASPEECFDFCNNNTDCLSFDFQKSSPRCMLKYIVATSPGSTFTSSPGYDHYQRQCQ